MREGAIGQTGAALFFLAICAMPAAAEDLPTRKAGLWEITTGMGDRSVKMQQCVDAATDHAMQTRAGTAPHGDCSKHDVQKSGTTTTIDAVCTIAGKTRTSHIVIAGSFDSAYTLTVTGQTEGQPAGPPATLTAKWLGPCAGRSETWRHDHAERHEDEHPEYAEHAKRRGAAGRRRCATRALIKPRACAPAAAAQTSAARCRVARRTPRSARSSRQSAPG
jgi:hypothetical protein